MDEILQIRDVLDTDPGHAYDTVARALQATDWPRFLITERSEIRVPEGAGRVIHITQDEIASKYISREQLLEHPPQNFHLINDPLVNHKITQIRSADTSGATLEHLVDEVSLALAVAATKDLPERPLNVVTPVCTGMGSEIDESKPVIVPILRAGLFMLRGIESWLAHVKIGIIGMYRNHTTLLPIIYYAKLPDGCQEIPGGGVKKRACYICDPMLATGVSSVAAIEIAKSFGYERINFLSLFAVPQGVNAILIAHPDVEIYTAALDEGLTSKGYIVPGISDAGDRLTGTK